MKRIISIFLCIMLALSFCTFSVMAEESAEETAVNLFTEAKVVNFGYSGTKNSETIKNLSASGDGLYAKVRQTMSRTYQSDAYFAVEFDTVYNLTGVEIVYEADDKAIINNYRVFATETKSYFDEAVATPERFALSEYGKMQYYYPNEANRTETLYPGTNINTDKNQTLKVSGVVDKLIADGDLVATGNGSSSVGSLNVTFDVPKNAKYLIFAIDKNVDSSAQLGFNLDQIKVYGKSATPADDELCDIYKHYTNPNITVIGCKDKSSTVITDMLNSATEATTNLGTTGYKSETQTPSNFWFAFDLGEEKTIERIDMYEKYRHIGAYRIYLTSDASFWNEVLQTSYNNRMGLSEKGKVQRKARPDSSSAWPTVTEGDTVNADNIQLTVDGTLDKLRAAGALVGAGKGLATTGDTVNGYQTYYLNPNSKGRYLIFVVDELASTAYSGTPVQYFDIMGYDNNNAVTELDGEAFPETITRPDGNQVTVSAKLLNTGLSALKNTFLAAQYNGDGAMVKADIFNRVVMSKTGKKINEIINLHDETAKIKLFVWDKDTLRPLNSSDEVLVTE